MIVQKISGEKFNHINKIDLPGTAILLNILIFTTLLILSVLLPSIAFSLLHSGIIFFAVFLFAHQAKITFFIEDSFLSMIPIVYLSAALLDFILFAGNESSINTWVVFHEFQFRISSDFIEAAGVLSVFLLIKMGISFRFIRYFYFLIPLVFIVVILFDIFPACIVNHQKLTVFSIVISLTTVAFFVINIILLLSFTKESSSVCKSLALSFIMTILSVLLNLLLSPLFQNLSLFLKTASYYFLYSGIIFEGLIYPFEKMKNKEHSFREEQFYYAQTLTALKDGMFRYYPEKDLLEVSPVWMDMTGYKFHDDMITNDYLHELFEGDEYDKLKRVLEISFKESSPLTKEFKIRHKTGSLIWVLIRGNMGKDHKGNHCFIGIMTDISWRKKIEQELILAKEKAEESDKLKTAFLANISHEIRTPLNVILGFTGLILKDLPDDEKSDERMKSLDLVRQSSNQLISIISDIIDISRIQNESINLQNQEISVNTFFKNIHTVYRKLMDDRGKNEIRLTWYIPEEITGELFISTDIERFHQIWQNLLNNSMKFIEYGQIRYGVNGIDSLNNQITFFVEDTGPGISKDKDSIIFERFRQGEEGFARRYGGSGLGLTITRELLHLMGGYISLDTDYTGGARFLFTLPERPQ